MIHWPKKKSERKNKQKQVHILSKLCITNLNSEEVQTTWNGMKTGKKAKPRAARRRWLRPTASSQLVALARQAEDDEAES